MSEISDMAKAHKGGVVLEHGSVQVAFSCSHFVSYTALYLEKENPGSGRLSTTSYGLSRL